MKTTTTLLTAKKVALFILLLAGLFKNIHAQKKFKDYLLTGSAMLVSGMIDGTKESISFHYQGFKRFFPKANDKFWDPSISWRNKYKNNDPAQGQKFYGSTNMLVFTTDAYHALRTTQRAIDGLVLVSYMNKNCTGRQSFRKRFKSMAKDFLILTAIRCVGFNLTYNLAFNPSRNYMIN